MQTDAAVPPVSYKRHRVPAEIISHAVWLYHRFGLSLRDVQELLAERGVAVTYETIHQSCRKFGPTFARALRHRRPRPGDKWHVDEVQLKMNGRGDCPGSRPRLADALQRPRAREARPASADAGAAGGRTLAKRARLWRDGGSPEVCASAPETDTERKAGGDE